MRLDVYLVENHLVPSRSRGAELIAKGLVEVNGAVATKASVPVCESDTVRVVGHDHDFVSRGGMKLEAALSAFAISVEGLVCADIGASTGGFTHCLLKRGAALVYAVDSGHGQLHPDLSNDSRVINLEGCNARHLSRDVVPEACECVVADLSFISQTLVIPAITGLMEEGGIYTALIKPQFECGREGVGKGGIVRDKKQHTLAIRRVLAVANENGLAPQGLIASPILGGDGNREFLFYAVKGGVSAVTEQDIAQIVKN